MELSVREAAALLGRSPRTIRAQLVRGDLSGRKRNGSWRIERRHLPLTETQRRAFQAKATAIRQAVEDALPPRLAQTRGQRSRSIADLDAFRYGARLLADLRAAEADALRAPTQRRVAGHVERALLALAAAAQHFDRELKLSALNRARTNLAHATALLLVEAGIPPPDPVREWVAALENQVIPAVAGFTRWVENLRGKKP